MEHCPTGAMIADCLTKLATSPVIQVLLDAMQGSLPTLSRQPRHKTSVTPGPQNRGDIAGDGPLIKQPRHRTSVTPGPWNRGDITGDGPSRRRGNPSAVTSLLVGLSLLFFSRWGFPSTEEVTPHGGIAVQGNLAQWLKKDKIRHP